MRVTTCADQPTVRQQPACAALDELIHVLIFFRCFLNRRLIVEQTEKLYRLNATTHAINVFQLSSRKLHQKMTGNLTCLLITHIPRWR